MGNFIDLTGKQFGNLIVLERTEHPKDKKRTYWLCECQCEKKTKIIVEGYHLRSGHTTSCGCLKKKQFIERSSKGPNIYKIFQDKVMGYNEEDCFIIDKEDYDKVKQYRWHLDHYKYWVADIEIDEVKKRIKLHRFIMNAESNQKVDHKDRNKNNNRKENLRFCTIAENNYNKIQNPEKYVGVRKRTDTGKWSAKIQYKHKIYNLGCFEKEEDALIARLKAEKKFFREFAPQRHLFEKYNI